MRGRLAALLAGCTRGPPFTLQRFAELLLAPNKQYSQFLKLVRRRGKPYLAVLGHIAGSMRRCSWRWAVEIFCVISEPRLRSCCLLSCTRRAHPASDVCFFF